MKSKRPWIRDTILFLIIQLACFGISILLQDYFHIPEQVTTAFAFGVFLISLMTNGYFYGLLASLTSVILVNYAFTFPYFAINFFISSNFFSAIVMMIIAVLTSTLTTKLKQAEAMKAESERERMRANLLRAISHDLRTPLTTIYGSSTTLLENGERFTDGQKNKLLKGIQEDSQWLVQMVENLLSITRIDAGQVQLNKTPTALDELIDAVIVKFRKRYPQQALNLELPDELVIIPMDALLIQQVLINILENAMHHGRNLTQITLRVLLRDGWAIFEVQDDGCGIAPERLDHVFTGYFETKGRPIDNAKRNAGIGLSVCATIIRAHGGTIAAENVPEGGALFRFTLQTEDMSDEQQI